MLPSKHLEETSTLIERRKKVLRTLSYIFFPVSALLLGPALHELSHILLLESIGCGYSMTGGIGLGGVFAEVQPYCSPADAQLFLFYMVGYLNTIIFGGYMCLQSFRTEKNISQLLYASLGTGILVSVLLSLSLKGDIANATRIIGLPAFYGHAMSGILFLGCSATTFRTLEHLWDTSERQD